MVSILSIRSLELHLVMSLTKISSLSEKSSAGDSRQCTDGNRRWDYRGNGRLFTVSVEELVVRAVLGVSGDALHPPL